MMVFRFLKFDHIFNTQLRDLLRSNKIGTPKRSMVYQHQRVDEKLDHIHKPQFISVRSGKMLLGTCCFCERMVYNQGKELRSFYIRYFTFRNSIRASSRGITRVNRSNSLLKEEIRLLIDQSFFQDGDRGLFYAYIDPQNTRSMDLANEFGFSEAGFFNVLFYSRFFPKRSRKVQQIDVANKNEIADLLGKFYRSHNFFCGENIFYKDHYFVIRNEGEVVAGLQACPEHWKVFELPGNNGKFILNVLSRLPLLRKIFSKDFHFLSVEAIYCKKGFESYISEILQDALSRFNIHSAVFCLDPGSIAYKMVKSLDLGFLNKLSKEKSFSVMVKSREVKIDKGAPCYVSAFDVM